MAWLRTLLVWLAFLTCLFLGAALLLSTSSMAQGIGIGLLAAPLAVLAYLTLAHYVRERREAER